MHPKVREDLFVCALIFVSSLTYVLFSSYYSIITILVMHAMNLAFAKIPIGAHSMCACVATSAIGVLISILLRSSLKTIVPFEAMFISIIGQIAGDILFGMIKFIPVKDKRTGQVKR